MPPLTDSAIKSLKPTEKLQKHFDGGGLFLLVNTTGSKLWRLKYRIAGKEKLLALGDYKSVSLKEAREARDEARKQIARGIDPSLKRKSDKVAAGNSFKAIADEYLKLRVDSLAAVTVRKAEWQLREFILPAFGDKQIEAIKPSDVLAMLRKIESTGALETVRKTKELCGRIFRFAVATDRSERDPTTDLRGALKPPVVRSHAAITDPAKVGELMRAIDGYEGQSATAAALKLLPRVFTRPGELRQAKWDEFNLDAAEWRIPADRMKMRREHIVPLSKQAVAILREIHPITCNGSYVFPAIGTRNRPLSENTINAALRRLGYGNRDMVAHGFRALASTLLNELGHAPDIIELQLAHKDKDAVRAVYNRAQRLPERRKMMQAWADYLDGLRVSANVTPIKRSA